MLDSDLAELYGVTTFNLNKAVLRNVSRFPNDFMFSLSKQDVANLTFQFGISSLAAHGGRRSFPNAFTQEGIAMLSSVLRSEQAVQVNLQIMRTFVRMREMLVGYDDLALRIDQLEERFARRRPAGRGDHRV